MKALAEDRLRLRGVSRASDGYSPTVFTELPRLLEPAGPALNRTRLPAFSVCWWLATTTTNRLQMP